ncbi:UvrD-helicase domain-containing protein [Bacillus luteolus]|uniref:UvrD-helicase domain-containing protein n=1 Tax=Litchfieldia luteola TaxID=682179 RepID=A0ABR9QMP5_9BACI|nr:RNA polymerase recycling motor HelD [Cytobacillus luteolus]MBE4909769.1 UvrD-helicase domain-containing protein [Cytobacillus luteolus]MBP1942689.1 DNA helicase-2/ATP-dependent DNA helicase PcrA [Cytobacillus luteolus]
MTEKNKNWIVEEERINQIKNVILSKMESLKGNTGDLKGDIIDLRNTFWDDVKVNLDGSDEISETYLSIKQQAELLSERERSHRLFHKQLKTLSRLKDSPYFGRIDFLEEGEKVSEQIYLGISSLMDENDEQFLIYDWRAPISSLYYDFSPGKAHYETMDGTVEGEMELKRQFIVRQGNLKAMFDTGVTIGDDLLKEVLSNQSDNQMKSIVATIQKEQNQIIRSEGKYYLIVQGSAGSGKTSAALQRVAYLLYRYRGTLSSDNIMLFSPNPLFNSYVSTVLPELGEENMEQTTFQEYLVNRIGDKFTVEDAFSQMEFLLTSQEQSREFETRLAGIRYKASLEFKDLIDKYIELLSEEGLRFRDLRFKGRVLVSSVEISNYFYSLNKNSSIQSRMMDVVDWLLKELRTEEKKEQNKDWVIEEAELMSPEDHLKIYKKLQKQTRFTEDTFDDFEREQRLIAKVIVKRYFKPLNESVKSLRFIDLESMYLDLFVQNKDNDSATYPQDWKGICNQTINRLKDGTLAFEDTTPFIYLQDQLEGQKSNTMIRHLFIDEAQDYSPFQLAFFKQLFPKSRMTILGDVNQAIFAHSISSPTLLSTELYKDEKVEKITLTQSYRSTKEIIEFTKGIVSGGEEIKPFNRAGSKPTVLELESSASMREVILDKIKALKDAGHETVAIICKTATESEEVYKELNSEITIKLMKKNTSTFDKGVLILPAYLAKGIEFDAVLIWDASDTNYHKEYERNLFYVACTRAMHELHLYSLGKMSRFIANTSTTSYDLVEVRV